MATITVTPGHTYGSTDTVTSTNLNNLGDPSVALDAGTIVNADISASADIAGSKLASDALEAAYPVGSIYMNASDGTNPNTLLGFGTWAAFGAGRVPVGFDSSDTDFDTAEETGGAKTHTLSIDEMPAHNHDFSAPIIFEDNSDGGNNGYGGLSTGQTSTVGGDQAHNNLQPYIVVYMWKRTA
tara:strand:+ start:1378 stop:1926 length:549 start_codon:yes stop_codon:yes gene_type:complete